MTTKKAKASEPLPGMPEETKPAPRWFDVCLVGAVDWAEASYLLGIAANVPNLDDGDAELLNKAAQRLARIVMQEIGRVEYEAAQDGANDRIDAMIKKVRSS